MKNKILFIVLTAVLVLLLIGAYVVYASYEKNEEKPDNLVVLDGYVPPKASDKNTDNVKDTLDTEKSDTDGDLGNVEETANTEAEDSTPDDTQSNAPLDSDTQSPDTETEDTQPKETEPVDTQPKDTEPADTQPKETEPEVDPSLLSPDFTVYDKNGKAYKLSDFFGKPIVLNFWASWCGPCQYEMPEFERAYEEYGDDVHFLLVNLTDGSYETVNSASSFISKNGYTFPVYYDTAEDAAYKYDTSSIPVTFFIDSRGVMAAYARGALDYDTLVRGLSYIYAG